VSRARADDGVGLLDLLIAVVILGIAVTAILGGLATATKSSALNSERAEASSALTIAVEHLSTLPYAADCSGGAAYESAIDAALTDAGSDVVVSVTVEYWDGVGFGPDCIDDEVAGRYRLQQIRVDAEYGRVDETLTVVKRETA
jgi:Tfp pilus assembly protein PilV